MNFLNIHILQTIPLSNLNRDDAGSPKSVIYGGTNRARLSSQALKRAARTQFEAESPADMTNRSKFLGTHLYEEVLSRLTAAGVEVTEAMEAAAKKMSSAETKKLTSKDKKDAEKKSEKAKTAADDAGDTLVWLAETEVHALAGKIAAKLLAEVAEDLTLDGWVHSATSSLTIAGFGRMFANAPHVQTEAAAQVAHAFTTHAAVTEIDYFTAVDDLRANYLDDAGAGHLDLAEFTSGVFYRYLNVDRRQLVSNWLDLPASTASARLNAWFQALLLSLPSGKANSTAPQTLPFLIIVQESSLPVSLADAFEAAVADGGNGFAEPSRERLLAYNERMRTAAGDLVGRSMILDLADLSSGGSTFGELSQFATNWILHVEDLGA